MDILKPAPPPLRRNHRLRRVRDITKRTIIIPVADNDGRSLSAAIARINSELLGLAGGFSATSSDGMWRSSDGIVYEDQHLTYTVYSDEVTDAEVVERLGEWADWLKQQALLTDSTVVELGWVLAANSGETDGLEMENGGSGVCDHICHSFSTYDLLTELLTGQDNGVQHGTPEAKPK